MIRLGSEAFVGIHNAASEFTSGNNKTLDVSNLFGISASLDGVADKLTTKPEGLTP